MTEEQAPGTRRPRPRKRVLLAGIVSYGKGAHWFDCAIRDITRNGARLRIPRDRQIPTNFHLIVVREQVALEAKIVWNKGEEIGVALSRSIDLSKGLDPALGFLRQQWLERAAR